MKRSAFHPCGLHFTVSVSFTLTDLPNNRSICLAGLDGIYLLPLLKACGMKAES